MADDRREEGLGDPLEPRDPLDPYGTTATTGAGSREPSAARFRSAGAATPTTAAGGVPAGASSSAGNARGLPAPLVALFTGLVLFGAGFLAGRTITTPSGAGTAAAVDLRPIDEKLTTLDSRLDELSAALETRDQRWNEGLSRREAPAADLAPITEKLDALAARLADPPPAARLEAIDGRLDALAEGQNTVADGVRSLAEPIARLGERLDQQRTALDALADRLKTAPAQPPPAAPAAAGTTESELTRAAELFRRAEYGPALQILQRLQRSTPEDPRVWYFSALATGLSTGVWTGEAVRLVERGVEQERADPTTTSQQVETAFTGLKQPNAKDWLDYYRRRGR